MLSEETAKKTLAVIVRAGQLSGEILQNAVREVLAKQGRGAKGKKQSLRSLIKEQGKLTNIDLKIERIQEFDRIAKKFHVSYSAMSGGRDESGTRNYVIFFRADDAERIDLALKRYASKKFKPSIHNKIEAARKLAAERSMQRSIQKAQVRGLER